MEGKKHLLVSVLIVTGLFLYIHTAYGQNTVKEEIYEAYARGKMDKWYTVMKQFEAGMNKSSRKDVLDLVSYYYGYTGWLISVDKYDLAEDYIDKTVDILDGMLKKNPDDATVLAFKGAFLAYDIGMYSYKVIYLGRKSMGYIDKALEIDPENVQANTEKGNSLYYCPPTFGGSKEEAIQYYRKAARRMEKLNLVEDNWMYLNVMTALGMAYEATDQIHNAKLCYEKILRVKPNFMWVGEELYPDMIKRHNL